jgi:hypothetical protein
MDERAINGAAIEAIRDLDVDCEIKEVCKGSEADEWCVQFSDKYGQFCDKFQNQFGEENSPEVMREKIKAFLIKQVAKIRSSTGRKRRPAASAARESRATGGGLLAEPLKVVGEVLGRATGLASQVIGRTSDVAETARATLSAADLDTAPPAASVVQSSTGEAATAPPRKVTGRTIIRAAPAKPKKSARKGGAKKSAKKAARKKSTGKKRAAARK